MENQNFINWKSIGKKDVSNKSDNQQLTFKKSQKFAPSAILDKNQNMFNLQEQKVFKQGPVTPKQPPLPNKLSNALQKAVKNSSIKRFHSGISWQDSGNKSNKQFESQLQTSGKITNTYKSNKTPNQLQIFQIKRQFDQFKQFIFDELKKHQKVMENIINKIFDLFDNNQKKQLQCPKIGKSFMLAPPTLRLQIDVGNSFDEDQINELETSQMNELIQKYTDSYKQKSVIQRSLQFQNRSQASLKKSIQATKDIINKQIKEIQKMMSQKQQQYIYHSKKTQKLKKLTSPRSIQVNRLQ